LGSREIETAGRFYIPKGDLQSLKKGARLRLMELYNVEVTAEGPAPRARYVGDELVREMKKVQWVVPDGVRIRVLEPGVLFDDEGAFAKDSMGEADGVAEAAVSSLGPGEIVQFPRFGFCRLDSPGTFILSQR
jgi:glutamyl-tRNA synthetase